MGPIAVQAAQQNVGAEFDVREVAGGATVGTYVIRNLVIPQGAIIRAFNAKVYTLLTSGGIASISWGLLDLQTGSSTAIASLSGAQTFNAYNAGVIVNFPEIPGPDFNVNPLHVYNPSAITISISGATLTGGALSCVVGYSLRVANVFNF